jgi:hypothetical protein
MTSREAFEAYLRNKPHFPKEHDDWAYTRDTLGNYNNNRVDDEWQGWKAGRESMREEAAKVCDEIGQPDCRGCEYAYRAASGRVLVCNLECDDCTNGDKFQALPKVMIYKVT